MYVGQGRIHVAVILRTTSRILDVLVPETHATTPQDMVDAVLEAAERHDLTEALGVVRQMLEANPCWLRGYLFLAVIHEDTGRFVEAIHALGRGLDMCAQGFRLCHGRRGVLGRAPGETVLGRDGKARDLERFRRYQQIYLHHMRWIQLRCGVSGRGMEQWAGIGDVPCA